MKITSLSWGEATWQTINIDIWAKIPCRWRQVFYNTSQNKFSSLWFKILIWFCKLVAVHLAIPAKALRCSFNVIGNRREIKKEIWSNLCSSGSFKSVKIWMGNLVSILVVMFQRKELNRYSKWQFEFLIK